MDLDGRGCSGTRTVAVGRQHLRRWKRDDGSKERFAMSQHMAGEKASAGQGTSPGDEKFDTSAVMTISVTHFVHDTYPGFLAPLLPVLIARHGIPLAAAGGLFTIYRAASLIQPFLGVWADRTDSRYFVIAAPTITAITMCLLGMAPSYLAVALLLAVTGLSVAIFHPAAAATVTRYSGRTWGRGSSLFMFGGEMGRSFGPLVFVSWIAWFGLESLPLAAIPGVLLSVLLYFRLGREDPARLRSSSVAGIWQAVKAQRRALLLLSGLVLFRSISVTSFVTFYPTFLTGRGSALVFAGMALALYELAGAGGALAGGTLSDRFGRRNTLMVTQLVSGPLLFVTLTLPDGPTQLVVLAIAGAVALSASPVQLTLAQELLPGGKGTATGILFFLGFEGTLVSTLVVGAIADVIGLGPALGMSVLASMLSIPFTLALPETGSSS